MKLSTKKINKNVVHGTAIPNYSNAQKGNISVNIYSRKNHPSGFYVYAYIRRKDSVTAKAGTPYYIGKGVKGRAYNNNGHSVPLPINDDLIVILESNLTDVGAQAIERRLIRWYGRVDIDDGGILRNTKEGGDGARLPDHLVRRGSQHPQFGRRYRLTDKQREKQKGKNKGNLWWNNGSEQMMATDCPGKEWIRGRLPFNNAGAYIAAECQRGKFWITNGTTERMISFSEEIEAGYHRGRMPSKIKGIPNVKASTKKWWTNGTETRMSEFSPGQEWRAGRL